MKLSTEVGLREEKAVRIYAVALAGASARPGRKWLTCGNAGGATAAGDGIGVAAAFESDGWTWRPAGN